MNRRDEIAQNLLAVQGKITRPDITLIAVTKTYPVSDVQILYELGVRNFGENRNEEGLEKAAQVEGRWHFQGEIQSRRTFQPIAILRMEIHLENRDGFSQPQ